MQQDENATVRTDDVAVDADATTDAVVAAPVRPSVLKIVGLLAGAALVLSWLVSYAVLGALEAADLIRPFAGRPDPRPTWMGAVFVVLTLVFALVAVTLRRASGKELAEIDDMTAVGDDDGKGEDLLRITGPGAKRAA